MSKITEEQTRQLSKMCKDQSKVLDNTLKAFDIIKDELVELQKVDQQENSEIIFNLITEILEDRKSHEDRIQRS